MIVLKDFSKQSPWIYLQPYSIYKTFKKNWEFEFANSGQVSKAPRKKKDQTITWP